MRTEIKYINGIKVINTLPKKATDEEREQFLYDFNKLLDSIIRKQKSASN